MERLSLEDKYVKEQMAAHADVTQIAKITSDSNYDVRKNMIATAKLNRTQQQSGS